METNPVTESKVKMDFDLILTSSIMILFVIAVLSLFFWQAGYRF